MIDPQVMEKRIRRCMQQISGNRKDEALVAGKKNEGCYRASRAYR